MLLRQMLPPIAMRLRAAAATPLLRHCFCCLFRVAMPLRQLLSPRLRLLDVFAGSADAAIAAMMPPPLYASA